jgi:hypothetical protein
VFAGIIIRKTDYVRSTIATVKNRDCRHAERRYRYSEALGGENAYTVSAITLRMDLHSRRCLPNGGTADSMCKRWQSGAPLGR